MKKKNGFTLIEILVVIALILSLITLAIISTVKISERKKKESYNLVVKEILVAAENYLENNTYYKENLTNSNYINISLGKLIKEDYLNVVTNPITNKKFDKCNYIKVTKNDDNKLNYDFKSNEKDCSDNDYVKVAPEISIKKDGEKGDNGWYKYNTKENPGVIITINATDKISGIASIELKTNNGYKKLEMKQKGSNEAYSVDKSSFSKTTTGKKVCYKATNYDGMSNESCVNLKVDVNFPSCELTVVGDMEGSTYVYYTSSIFTIDFEPPEVILTYSDIGSGIYTKKISSLSGVRPQEYNPNQKYIQKEDNDATWEGTVTDYAGNINTCGKSFKVQKRNITDKISKDYCGKKEGTSTSWTNKDRTITQYFNKTLSSETTKVTETYKTTTKTSSISNGNIKCSVNVYVDKDKPVFDSINIPNNTVKLSQWDNYGNQILSSDVSLKKQSNGKYYGEACVLNKPGYFDISGYNIIAKDNDSGINNNSYETTWDYFSLSKNKEIGAQCLKTSGDNPCLMKEHVYVYDNAGNKSDDIGKLEIKIGYKGIDDFCK